MSNLPGDFESYTGICDRCGESFHSSGVDVCGCVQCEWCEVVKPPKDFPARTEMAPDGICNDCDDEYLAGLAHASLTDMYEEDDRNNDCDGDDGV